MRILIAHNRYQNAGGEDAVMQTECDLLKRFGEEVYLYERTNHEINSYPIRRKISFLWEMNWSRRSYRELKKIIREFRPDVAHFHNIFFMMTPSVYYACREENIPVVQSQHNFRLFCSNGLLFRDNHICEECLEHSLWRGVRYRCYKKSRFMTTLLVRTIEGHWKKGTWVNMIDCYITATEFTRQKYIAVGIPPEKILVKPHFVYPDSGIRDQDKGYALYVGRLSPEKGVSFLLKAWRDIKDVPLKIMGSGPLCDSLRSFASSNDLRQVEFLGYLAQEQYTEYMKGAKFIIVPSVCYENFPRVIAEAYAFGIPVLASRLGTMADLLQNNVTGILFDPENISDLRAKVKWLASQDEVLKDMGKRARRLYEEKYAAEKNYEILLGIYKKAIEFHKRNNNYAKG